MHLLPTWIEGVACGKSRMKLGLGMTCMHLDATWGWLDRNAACMQVRALGEICLERRHAILARMLKIDARDQMIEVLQETAGSTQELQCCLEKSISKSKSRHIVFLNTAQSSELQICAQTKPCD